MIIRKPYAFLIKNFKRIHIFLLLLSLFVAYKLIDISSFVNEFMRLGTYDLFQDPVTNHISTFLMISLLLLSIGSLSLLILLHYKKKPWKIYLAPVIEYLALFFVMNMIRGFFRGYSSVVEPTDLRLSRDLLFIFTIAQIPVIIIFIVRVFGLDVKKFQFNSDQEFLELSEEDREEIEIGFSIDKNSISRGFKRFLRHFNYFYMEHKGICRMVVVVLILILGFRTYRYIFVINKSYTQGDFYSANGYTFRVNQVYFTDKDYHGNVISEKSNFVIVDLTIQNNSSPRTVYLENFHIRNGISDEVTTRKTYMKEFQDLGVTYESTKELKRNEKLDCIIVYKVDKELNPKKFVLYYQEDGGFLRKIKLNVKDIREILKVENLSLGDEFELGIKTNNDTIVFDYADITDYISYTTRFCKESNCTFQKNDLWMNGEDRILEINFGSDVYEAKNMIDFLNNYGKLKYEDSNGKESTLEFVNPIGKVYYGKSVFLKVPVELEDAKSIYFDIIIRNKHYVYKLV